MLRILYFLLLDGFFIYALIAFGSEMRWYIIIHILAVVFFTWELIRSIRNW